MPRTGKRGKYKLRPLSPKQITMFKYLIDYISRNEFPPSIREIGDHAGIPSTSVVNYNLNKLEEHKLIFRWKEVSRAIRINWPRAVELGFAPHREEKQRLFQIPLLGNIVASNPVNVRSQHLVASARTRRGLVRIGFRPPERFRPARTGGFHGGVQHSGQRHRPDGSRFRGAQRRYGERVADR